jgi:hypothetical protein
VFPKYIWNGDFTPGKITIRRFHSRICVCIAVGMDKWWNLVVFKMSVQGMWA